MECGNSNGKQQQQQQWQCHTKSSCWNSSNAAPAAEATAEGVDYMAWHKMKLTDIDLVKVEKARGGAHERTRRSQISALGTLYAQSMRTRLWVCRVRMRTKRVGVCLCANEEQTTVTRWFDIFRWFFSASRNLMLSKCVSTSSSSSILFFFCLPFDAIALWGPLSHTNKQRAEKSVCDTCNALAWWRCIH